MSISLKLIASPISFTNRSPERNLHHHAYHPFPCNRFSKQYTSAMSTSTPQTPTNNNLPPALTITVDEPASYLTRPASSTPSVSSPSSLTVPSRNSPRPSTPRPSPPRLLVSPKILTKPSQPHVRLAPLIHFSPTTDFVTSHNDFVTPIFDGSWDHILLLKNDSELEVKSLIRGDSGNVAQGRKAIKYRIVEGIPIHPTLITQSPRFEHKGYMRSAKLSADQAYIGVVRSAKTLVSWFVFGLFTLRVVCLLRTKIGSSRN